MSWMAVSHCDLCVCWAGIGSSKQDSVGKGTAQLHAVLLGMFPIQ